MNTVLIDCFGFSDRIALVREYFQSLGDTVYVISSDFDHARKKVRPHLDNSYIYIHVYPYFKNLSLRRLFSHWDFARKALQRAEQLKPERIYTLIPPNSMGFFVQRYKRKYPKTEICFDLIDLWPESLLGASKLKEFFPFTLWRNLRNKALKHADRIITECDLYRNILKDIPEMHKAQTLYLTNKNRYFAPATAPKMGTIKLCYLGTINNIIDISFISKLIRALASCKPVELHIIGDGETRESLISEASQAGASVIHHGITYDKDDKNRIFNQCHFGLNIMKPQVCVGLTIKSLDYFAAGLPLLNDIGKGYDTWALIERDKIGFNITEQNINSIAQAIAHLTDQEWYAMSQRTRGVFENVFSLSAIRRKFKDIFAENSSSLS